MSKEQAIPAADAAKQAASVPLETAIIRGGQRIDRLDLRKPGAGELRGLKLVDVINMDVTALITLLPRITSPTLTTADVSAMDLPDLTACAVEVASFFLTRAQRATQDFQPA